MSEVLSQPYPSVPMLGLLFHVFSPWFHVLMFFMTFLPGGLKGNMKTDQERPPFVMSLETHRLSDSYSNGLSSQRNDHLYVLPHSYFPHTTEIQILIVKYKYFFILPSSISFVNLTFLFTSVSHWFKYRLEQAQGKWPVDTIFHVLINLLANVL